MSDYKGFQLQHSVRHSVTQLFLKTLVLDNVLRSLRNKNTNFCLNFFPSNFVIPYVFYRFYCFQFGSRVENLDDVIEQVISKVRRRQKRSLLDSFWSSWFSHKVSDDDSNTTEKPTGRSTRAVSKSMSRRRRVSVTKKNTYHQTSSRPTTRPTTRPMTTRPSYSVKQAVSLSFLMTRKVQKLAHSLIKTSYSTYIITFNGFLIDCSRSLVFLI